MAAAASFNYKIGGGGLIFVQNWRQGFGNITGSCSDMVWILAYKLQEPDNYMQSWALNTFLYLNTKYMLKMYLNTKYLHWCI